ncbi:MAG: TlpA family protein disulfide reductase, partial [Halioglobus sp.]|nr:TlpA family protein disulfide reductase [Halioglobus sp.]
MTVWRYLALALAVTACSPDNQAPHQGALETLRGQWLVINYWAKWCTPCIKEIPELNALAAARPDIRVLGVNFDGATGDELAQQEEEFGVAFRTLDADPAEELGIERPRVLPTTLLV